METTLIDNPFTEHQHEDERCVHELLQSIDFGLFLVVERLDALLGDEKAKARVVEFNKESNDNTDQ
jgi:hypothetical protein